MRVCLHSRNFKYYVKLMVCRLSSLSIDLHSSIKICDGLSARLSPLTKPSAPAACFFRVRNKEGSDVRKHVSCCLYCRKRPKFNEMKHLWQMSTGCCFSRSRSFLARTLISYLRIYADVMHVLYVYAWLRV